MTAMIRAQAVLPSKALRVRLGAELRRRVVQIMTQLEHKASNDFKQTYRTWQHKPTFAAGVQSLPDRVEMTVATDHPIYRYVERGTRPHVIRARHSPRLYFRTGYYAKTIPQVLTSLPGGRFGPWRAPQMVRHPGTEARQFSMVIRRRHQGWFVGTCTAAMRQLARRMR